MKKHTAGTSTDGTGLSQPGLWTDDEFLANAKSPQDHMARLYHVHLRKLFKTGWHFVHDGPHAMAPLPETGEHSEDTWARQYPIWKRDYYLLCLQRMERGLTDAYYESLSKQRLSLKDSLSNVGLKPLCACAIRWPGFFGRHSRKHLEAAGLAGVHALLLKKLFPRPPRPLNSSPPSKRRAVSDRPKAECGLLPFSNGDLSVDLYHDIFQYLTKKELWRAVVYAFSGGKTTDRLSIALSFHEEPLVVTKANFWDFHDCRRLLFIFSPIILIRRLKREAWGLLREWFGNKEINVRELVVEIDSAGNFYKGLFPTVGGRRPRTSRSKENRNGLVLRRLRRLHFVGREPRVVLDGKIVTSQAKKLWRFSEQFPVLQSVTGLPLPPFLPPEPVEGQEDAVLPLLPFLLEGLDQKKVFQIGIRLPRNDEDDEFQAAKIVGECRMRQLKVVLHGVMADRHEEVVKRFAGDLLEDEWYLKAEPVELPGLPQGYTQAMLLAERLASETLVAAQDYAPPAKPRIEMTFARDKILALIKPELSRSCDFSGDDDDDEDDEDSGEDDEGIKIPQEYLKKCTVREPED